MQFEQWIKAEKAAGKKITFASVSRKITSRGKPILPQTVWAHAKGVRTPSVNLILQYELLTGGKVKFDDWTALAARKRRAAKRKAA
jgi:hypothetical protein